MNPRIFRALDIRGKTGVDLTPPVAQRVGRGIGASLQARGQRFVVVGQDNRISSPLLADALCDGLAAAGCHVVDIGRVATPILYWAAVSRGNVGGVMVTASHLGPDYNGFKVCIGGRSLAGAALTEIQDRIASGALPAGAGAREQDLTASERYLADLAQRLPPAATPQRAVLDAGNGMAGPFAPSLLAALGHRVIPLFCEPDGHFPNHSPDPQKEENLRPLRTAVADHGADLGLAYDGDGDRVGVVDEQGVFVAADRVAVLLARELLTRHPGAKVVVDVLCSQVLIDEITRHGGKAILWKSGHSFIKEKLQQEQALLGIEMSGHMFFADDYYGYDDGIYASARIANLVAASGQRLSQLVASVPRLFATPEYRPHCPDERKQAVVNQARANLAQRFDLIAVDGVRVKFERGWGLLRWSNTEPVLSLRFEAETREDLQRYGDIFRQELRAFPEVASF